MKLHPSMVLSVSAGGLMLLMGSQLAPKSKTVTVSAMTEFERIGTTMDGWDWTTAS